MEKKVNEQTDDHVLPPPALGSQPMHTPDLPPLRRVTFAEVQKIAELLRARRATT